MELRRLPIIRLWGRVLVPLQGEITDEVAEQLTHEVLRAIHQSGARGLVLDLTGVWIMDSHLCAVLSNLASSAKLMGTPTVISGLSPEIAMTLQTMGVELGAVRTALTLEHALEILGLDVRERDGKGDRDDLDDDEDEGDEDEADEPAPKGREAARRGRP
jgi:rsbT antagonist protein RsbS